jgi:hypothetical protein
MTMQAVTDRPRVFEVEPQAAPEAPPAGADAHPTSDGFGVARGAMIGTVIALFPWSLVVLLLSWFL